MGEVQCEQANPANPLQLCAISAIMSVSKKREAREGAAMDRCDRSMMVIKRTIENNYDKFKTVGVFYLEKNAVLAEIAA